MEVIARCSGETGLCMGLLSKDSVDVVIGLCSGETGLCIEIPYDNDCEDDEPYYL